MVSVVLVPQRIELGHNFGIWQVVSAMSSLERSVCAQLPMPLQSDIQIQFISWQVMSSRRRNEVSRVWKEIEWNFYKIKFIKSNIHPLLRDEAWTLLCAIANMYFTAASFITRIYRDSRFAKAFQRLLRVQKDMFKNIWSALHQPSSFNLSARQRRGFDMK